MATVTLDVPEYLLPVLEDMGDQLPLVLEMGASRLAPVSTQAYMETVEFLSQKLTPQLIADFRFSDEVEKRVSALLEKQSAGTLTQAGEVELDRLSRLELQMQRIKTRALIQLQTG